MHSPHLSAVSLTLSSFLSFVPSCSELLGPAVVSVLDSGPQQIQVSWGPLQPERVQGYRVEYAALPGGHVRTVAVDGHRNSAVLAGLEPDTQYLVTISALHAAGGERAMSVKACTPQEGLVPPAVRMMHACVCALFFCVILFFFLSSTQGCSFRAPRGENIIGCFLGVSNPVGAP